MKTVVVAVVGLSWEDVGAAHDRWADGGPVPSWVEAQCRGVSDLHRPTVDQVQVTPDGYKLDGYARVVREDRLLPSPDGRWWVFDRTDDDGSQSTAYRFFGAERGS